MGKEDEIIIAEKLDLNIYVYKSDNQGNFRFAFKDMNNQNSLTVKSNIVLLNYDNTHFNAVQSFFDQNGLDPRTNQKEIKNLILKIKIEK